MWSLTDFRCWSSRGVRLSQCCVWVLLVFRAEFGVQGDSSFVNWETPPLHSVALSPNHELLALANLPAARLEVFDVGGHVPRPVGSVPVGLDPVSVRFRNASEAWVVCHISDAVNVVDTTTRQVKVVLPTLDGPMDVAFAGSPLRAYVSCAYENALVVFDPETGELIETIPINGERPKAMSVSPDGRVIYVAVFESGNASTILAPRFGLNFVPAGVVDFHDGPYAGMNPPPNDGSLFSPLIGDHLNEPPPRVGLIVKKDSRGRWLDDNEQDWSEFVSGSKAPLSGRPVGWDMPDRDVAMIDTESNEVSYVRSLMNICMDVAVNPADGTLAVVGTEAHNERRFEPRLNGAFISVNLALVDPASGKRDIVDLNSHLIGSGPTLDETRRRRSIGDPRQVVWTDDGSALYLAGTGSSNLLKLDRSGQRVLDEPLGLPGGPSGLALDDTGQRLFVHHRFSNQLSVVDTSTDRVLAQVDLFDPTPEEIRMGRDHLYNTVTTSGTGHTSCASCHVDGRFDRLAWDLGNPEGVMIPIDGETNFERRFQPEEPLSFHPMKGPMMTMTLQDIIGHEPFHWRGDRVGIEAFNPTFKELQGAPKELTHTEMAEFKAFLSTLHFPPNRHRDFGNQLARAVPLPGQLSLGRDGRGLLRGEPLLVGDAERGRALFIGTGACTACHTLSTGLGPHQRFVGRRWVPIEDGPMGERFVSLVQQPRSDNIPLKIASLRGLADKVGANFLGLESNVGFGFAHNGAVDSLSRFLQDGFNFSEDRATADLIAFLLSFTGREVSMGNVRAETDPPGLPSLDTHAAVGSQFLVKGGQSLPRLLQTALDLTNDSVDPVDVIAFQQTEAGVIGWYFDPATKLLEPDLAAPAIDAGAKVLGADSTESFLFMVVPPGSGKRMALDWDLDGIANFAEHRDVADPYSKRSTTENLPPTFEPVPTQAIMPGALLEQTIQFEDGNDPADTVMVTLLEGPDGMVLDESNRIRWVAPSEPSVEPWTVRLEARDDGSPPLTALLEFHVFVVDDLGEPHLERMNFGERVIEMVWNVVPGRTYQVDASERAVHGAWFPVTAPWRADQTTLALEVPATEAKRRYFRIKTLED